MTTDQQDESFLKAMPPPENESEIYVENIDRDEIRDGFLVTSHRKKLWNVQINLIKEFDRICKKHNIRWFAIGGTLIGAVRHSGFVPWDDDVDVVMFRPDFEKFKKVAPSEIKPQYHLDIWYNYRLEVDEPSELTDDSLPLVSLNHYKKNPVRAPFFPLIKLRDKRTLFFVRSSEKYIQSIFIDIFPLDPLPPFSEKQQRLTFDYARTFFVAAIHPEMIEATLQNKRRFLIDEETLRKLMSLPYKQRCMQLEDFLGENFFMSEHVGDLRDWCIVQRRRFYQSKDFQDVVYLPFEKIEMPAPVGYESVLTDFYGDWRTPSYKNPHAKIYSSDISWDEYLQKKS